MATTINAQTTSVGGIVTTADNTGNIDIQSDGTTVMSVTSAGIAVTGRGYSPTITLTDGANVSLPYKTSSISAGNCPGIDAHRPSISSVNFSPGHGKTLGIDSVLIATIEAKNLETGL